MTRRHEPTSNATPKRRRWRHGKYDANACTCAISAECYKLFRVQQQELLNLSPLLDASFTRSQPMVPAGAGTVTDTSVSVIASGPTGLTTVLVGAMAINVGAIFSPCMTPLLNSTLALHSFSAKAGSTSICTDVKATEA